MTCLFCDHLIDLTHGLRVCRDCAAALPPDAISSLLACDEAEELRPFIPLSFMFGAFVLACAPVGDLVGVIVWLVLR
jgi:hypothetical protein